MNFAVRDRRGIINILMVQSGRGWGTKAFKHQAIRWCIAMEWMMGVRR